MSDPPFLLVITSDPETLSRVANELERRYAPDYEVARATSAQEAAASSERRALDQRRVALILSSLKLSDGDGWEAMAFVRTRHPGALRVHILQPGNREENLMVQRPLQMGLADHYTLGATGLTRRNVPCRDHRASRRVGAVLWASLTDRAPGW